MAISDKLNYLIETKQLFKDRLNSLGAEITSSTTFRNYLNWLDTFYGEVSDKTDLSQNGVVGRTSQETTTGKNLANFIDSQVYNYNNGVPSTISRASVISNKTNNSYNIKYGTNSFLGVVSNTMEFEENTDYVFSFNRPYKSNFTQRIHILQVNNDDSYTLLQAINAGVYGTPYTYTYSNTTAKKVSFMISTNNSNPKDETETISEIMVRKSTTSDTYEPYTNGASPNPDYPQPINNLSGDVPYKVSGKNLFDKDSISNNEWLLANGTTESHNDFCVSDYIPIKENTDYYLPMTNTRRLKYYNSEKQPLTTSDWDITRSTVGQVITTPNNANYVRITIQYTVVDINTFQFEESSTATDFEPYILQTFNIPLRSKNLFDKNNFEVFDGYYIGGGGNFRTASNNHTARIIIEPNTTYTISKPLTTNNRLRVGISSHEMTTTEIFNIWGGSDTATDVTLTSASDSKYMYIFYAIGNEKQLALDTLQVEKGSTVTAYEPYYDIELCNIDTYEDKIYSSEGRFYLEKNIQKITVNGSEENWSLASTYTNTLRFQNTSLLANGLAQSGIKIKCNKFIVLDSNNNSDVEHVRNAAYNYPEFFFVFIDKTRLSDNTVNAFKTWLSSNNLLVYYILNTSTTTEITQENYPSLYNSLKQIQDYLTAYKINKEFILGYSSPEIEY